jgi:hypothetical protein
LIEIGCYITSANLGQKDVKPGTPTNLVATSIGPTEAGNGYIALTWDRPPPFGGYEVERSDDGSNYTLLGINGDGSWVDYPSERSTEYFYRVRGGSEGGQYSGYSNVASAISYPEAPTELSATATGANSIELSWTNNSPNYDVTKIESSTDGINFTEITEVATGVSTYSSTGLSPETQYFYRVQAFVGTVNSAYSNTADATTSAAAV